MRYKLIIEYKGTNFVGWQRQADNPNSIQEFIEKAITDFSGERVDLHASGRTDAGVHAFAQVAHFDLTKEQKDYDAFAFKMRAGLNHFLRDVDIAIMDCQPVLENFHSRFDAKMRHYQYRIINRHPHLALDKEFAWQVSFPLDLEKMIESSKYLIGQHDFSSFRDSECQADSPIRSIDKIEITKNDNLILMNFSAKSFLHHQVRNMVGTIVLAGSGKMKPQDMKTILESRDRTKSGANAPACGLYFVGVDY